MATVQPIEDMADWIQPRLTKCGWCDETPYQGTVNETGELLAGWCPAHEEEGWVLNAWFTLLDVRARLECAWCGGTEVTQHADGIFCTPCQQVTRIQVTPFEQAEFNDAWKGRTT